MKRQDFHFDLPEHLIAQYPLKCRSDSRLLVYHRQADKIEHRSFKELGDFLSAGDLLIMNDTRVIPARLFGSKTTGGKVEVLVERILSPHQCQAQIRASKAPKPGTMIVLDDQYQLSVLSREEDLFLCEANSPLDVLLDAIGHIPLPPYIQREDETSDLERYQTVYSKSRGSVAAPTAGLHFDETLLQQLTDKGVLQAYTTLHVGAGTFQPVRADDILAHKMHKERYSISNELCDTYNAVRENGGKVVAVGTTALRSLESGARKGKLLSGAGDTDIFIYPGYQFQIPDALLTNFHLPESTLLMLVAAFIGYEPMQRLYQTAIANAYRFFSYGDACLLLP